MPNTHRAPISLDYRRLLLLFVPLALAIFGVMQTHYWLTISAERSKLQESQRLGVELSRRVVADKLDDVVSEIQFLANHILQRTLVSSLSGNERREIRQFLATFSRYQAWYDQIRYLGLDGNELIRINQRRGQVEMVPHERLTNKSGRYYFDRLSELERGQVYISPLDLNVENNQVELPVKPTIRVGVALFSRNGDKVGYLLVNYNGKRLIDDFKQVSSHIADEMMLVNDQGYWLISHNEGNNWGFMFDHNKRFSDTFVEEWQRIQGSETGQFDSPNGMFAYKTLLPYQMVVDGQSESSLATDRSPGINEKRNAEAQGYHWKVISFASQQVLNGQRFDFLRSNALIYLLTLMLALFGAVVITLARQRDEAAKRQHSYESSFRRVLENIQLVAVMLDSHGKIIFCNDFFLQLSGYQRDALLGRDWVDLMPADEGRSGEYSRFLDELRQQRLPEQSEHELMTRQGQALLLAWNSTFNFEADGNIAGVTLLGRDITQQRDIEEQLVKLSQAVEQSPNTVMITDLQGNIEYVNPQFSELTGYSLHEAVGQRPSLLQSGDTDPQLYREMWQQISKGQTWQGVLKNRKKDGDFYWEQTTISPIFDHNQTIRHYLSVKEDISERLRLEQEIETQSEETRKNRELAAVGQMANMVAHDLRNPLSSIKMAMQILSKNPALNDADEIPELISISQEQIGYMEAILSDLLSYSRPASLKPEWLYLDRLMETTVIGLQKPILQHQVELVEYYQKGLPTLFGDPVQLRQVFSNLITNAVQAVEEQPEPKVTISITLLMTDSSPKVRVDVTDNGPGIDPCLSTKVFEPFFTNRAKGTGLGLAIVKQRVDRHRGTVSLNALPQGGTQATLVLPVNPPADDES
ncbi:MAG: PAS domain S-box protein [Motiliproteus sp.]